MENLLQVLRFSDHSQESVWRTRKRQRTLKSSSEAKSYREILKKREGEMRKHPILTITKGVEDFCSFQACIHHKCFIQPHRLWVWYQETTCRTNRVIMYGVAIPQIQIGVGNCV